ncbi:MAG: RHS repeat-associated core domain-containing protein, partial [bacterium]|nr:RHS repeat-associated core domain-containing protein [bacterium]
GLVHMNGRVYDPELGRFLSADPFVQDATDLQSLNRYTYVLNNPLSLTDSSGFFFEALFDGFANLFNAVFEAVQYVLKTVLGPILEIPILGTIFQAAVMVAVCSNPAACAAVAAAFSAARGGSLLDALTAAAVAYASASVFADAGAADGSGAGAGTGGHGAGASEFAGQGASVGSQAGQVTDGGVLGGGGGCGLVIVGCSDTLNTIRDIAQAIQDAGPIAKFGGRLLEGFLSSASAASGVGANVVPSRIGCPNCGSLDVLRPGFTNVGFREKAAQKLTEGLRKLLGLPSKSAPKRFVNKSAFNHVIKVYDVNIEVAANVRIVREGNFITRRTLILDDVQIFPVSDDLSRTLSMTNQVGRAQMNKVLGVIRRYAIEEGFDTLRIRGTRISGAGAGRNVDLKIKLP